MTKQDYINTLYAKYSKHGIDKDLLQDLFNDGIQNQGFSERVTFNLLRMSLGEQFHESEYFSVEEVSEITGYSEEETLQQIEKMNGQGKAEKIASWTWFFPNGIK